MDAGASSSVTFLAFGSTIFNFTSSTNNPRISAHVSILFIENAPDDDVPMDVQAQLMQANLGEAEQASVVVMEQEVKAPETDLEKAQHTQNAPKAEAGEVAATSPTGAEWETYGCLIVEEPPDE